MKILTICQGGNVRSVGLAYILKYQLGHDALAMSWEKNSLDTKKLLFEWADKIILMEKRAEEHIPDGYKDKIQVFDIGPDRWLNSLHPDLHKTISSRIDELNLK